MSGERAKRTFAKNLKHYMQIHGLKQSDIARISGVSQQSVSNWLNERQIPRMGAIEMLSQYFGINKSDLLDDHPERINSSRLRVDPQWGDDEANIEYLKDNPRLLDQYIELTRKNDTIGLLFDKVKDLSPKDVEKVLKIVELIDQENE
ncbi:helix-turn-helix domain-containing protein [Faecalibaculum rodentium]|uniref:helix-turn-helix domain-containing protein n=1 Tax=Faecalibaculum rodentium TaxID=1702221 RepID=UPI0027318AC4|nr:helix-turn-helix transcriptional regulator [Faecalibaculum rodentium]